MTSTLNALIPINHTITKTISETLGLCAVCVPTLSESVDLSGDDLVPFSYFFCLISHNIQDFKDEEEGSYEYQ
jgi:hypothetical protein